jgi:elongation factor P--(R)-beta-lysine ligase
VSGYRRAASPGMLRFRARILGEIRAFFAARGVLEVETPALSRSAATDLHLDSVAAELASLGRRWLHTSPEFAMKRLLADGIGDCYQICRVFRDGELGRWHQPEFTILEWYRVGWDEQALMDEVEALLHAVLGTRTSVRISYRDAFVAALGVDPWVGPAPLAAALKACSIDVPADTGDDALLDLAFGAVVAPGLDPERVTFVHDFPPAQAALAQIRPGRPPIAARFEAFARGLELANGWAELTDPAEQARRFERERQERVRQGRYVPECDEDFLAALERGLPESAGVAIGLDRLVAAAARAHSLAEVLGFVHEDGGVRD